MVLEKTIKGRGGTRNTLRVELSNKLLFEFRIILVVPKDGAHCRLHGIRQSFFVERFLVDRVIRKKKETCRRIAGKNFVGESRKSNTRASVILEFLRMQASTPIIGSFQHAGSAKRRIGIIDFLARKNFRNCSYTTDQQNGNYDGSFALVGSSTNVASCSIFTNLVIDDNHKTQ